MMHSEMDELYELYLMGVLEFEQSAEISDHLNRKCDYCLAHVQAASVVVGSLVTLAEVTPPAPQLRERVLSIASPRRQKASQWPLAFSLACAAAIALLIWGITERGTFQNTLMQLQEVSRQRNELRAAIAILSQSDTRTVQFGEAQSQPHGRVFLSRNGGVVFLGSHLPPLAAGKTFELWLIPAKGNPQAAGLFSPNSEGIAVNVLAQAINPAEFAAVAVSVEPGTGSPQPTTKPILIVPLA